MTADPAELLRQHGFKVTAQRLAVMRAVSSTPHLTADDVYAAVSADIGTISPPGGLRRRGHAGR